MKTIRDVDLCLNYEEKKLHYSTKYYSDFSFQTRFIGNYLRRQLRQINFESKDYKRILVNACQEELPPNKIFNTWLYAYIPFNKSQYENLKKEELPDFFIEMLSLGFKKAIETHEIPLEFLMTKLKEFKENNYINEWIFKSKTIKEIGIKATLFCKMTIDNFSLTLVLSKKNEVVFSREILKTLPDEIIYHYQFKDIAFENNKIIVTSWYDKPPLYELDLSFEN